MLGLNGVVELTGPSQLRGKGSELAGVGSRHDEAAGEVAATDVSLMSRRGAGEPESEEDTAVAMAGIVICTMTPLGAAVLWAGEVRHRLGFVSTLDPLRPP